MLFDYFLKGLEGALEVDSVVKNEVLADFNSHLDAAPVHFLTSQDIVVENKLVTAYKLFAPWDNFQESDRPNVFHQLVLYKKEGKPQSQSVQADLSLSIWVAENGWGVTHWFLVLLKSAVLLRISSWKLTEEASSPSILFRRSSWLNQKQKKYFYLILVRVILCSILQTARSFNKIFLLL